MRTICQNIILWWTDTRDMKMVKKLFPFKFKSRKKWSCGEYDTVERVNKEGTVWIYWWGPELYHAVWLLKSGKK